ncbi:MAG: QueT transporter family protein [Clostridia bacterium]|nr:QueT transporter family protein [Clostridia bacterium]
MNGLFSTKRLCRAGVIAALYVALTLAFGQMPYVGILQIRPAEALCILPLFFVEAVPALWVGCMIANAFSPFWIYDVFIGSAVTLLAALCTYFVGKAIRGEKLRIFVGGVFPVLLNALAIPLIIIFLCGDLGGYGAVGTAYAAYALSLAVTESVWVYLLGTPLALTVSRMRNKGIGGF